MLTRILLAGLLASTLAFAQRGGGGGGGRGGSNMPGMGFTGTRLDRMSDAQKEAAPIHDQMLKGHLAIAEAVAAGKSQEEVDKTVNSQAELETQMASIELHAFAKAVSVLEPDQKQRGIQMIFAMVRGAFNGKNWNLDQ